MTELTGRLAVREHLLDCTRCELHTMGTGPVPFSGPTPAHIAMVGEAPGAQEDKAGKPFIGPAGELIRRHLVEVGIDPETVFIANTASCWPGTDVKTPQTAHVAACRVNKLAQLDLADPAWVLVLGAVALSGFRPDLKISKARGRPFKPAATDYVCFSTYHPAAALRQRIYEAQIHADLVVFKSMVDEGVAGWETHIGDVCIEAGCSEWFYWIDDDGIPWCVKHMPEAGQEHKARVDADVTEAKLRALQRESGTLVETPPTDDEVWHAQSDANVELGVRLVQQHFPGAEVLP